MYKWLVFLNCQLLNNLSNGINVVVFLEILLWNSKFAASIINRITTRAENLRLYKKTPFCTVVLKHHLDQAQMTTTQLTLLCMTEKSY